MCHSIGIGIGIGNRKRQRIEHGSGPDNDMWPRGTAAKSLPLAGTG